MRKGISEVIIVILLLLIAVSLVSVLYVWSSTSIFKSYPEEAISRDYLRSRSCLSLENINNTGGTATLRNCGLVPLSNFTMYIDGAIIVATLPSKLDPNEASQINFSTQPLGRGYMVVSDLIETPYIVK